MMIEKVAAAGGALRSVLTNGCVEKHKQCLRELIYVAKEGRVIGVARIRGFLMIHSQ